MGDGTIILVLAGISVLLCFHKNFKWLYATGISSLAVLTYTFVTFHERLSDADSHLKSAMVDNPFQGIGETLMQSVQLQWGWAVLVQGLSC